MVSWLWRRRAGRRQLFTVSSRRHAVAVVVALLPEACRALPQVCRGDGVLPGRRLLKNCRPPFAGVSARSGPRFAHARAVHFFTAAVHVFDLNLLCNAAKTVTSKPNNYFFKARGLAR